MSLPLLHSPADVLSRLIVAEGYGSAPADGQAWPVFVSNEPDTPDRCVTLTDTTGVDLARFMGTGEKEQGYGVQVRVRSNTHSAGWIKAEAIARFLDESLYQEPVTVDAADYEVHQVDRSGGVLALGKETPTSKRSLFTINCVVALYRLA